jgi:hypothetical protein
MRAEMFMRFEHPSGFESGAEPPQPGGDKKNQPRERILEAASVREWTCSLW